ncbi:MAG TPA: hypothetical protein VKP30_13560 [Polyangiaceae bacterium]|nr:hypothetical protein [Polyangiaceae bacterium]
MRRAWIETLLLVASLVGCTKSETFGTKGVTFVGGGIINDPKNRTLRFDLLKYGLESFCTEMRKRGVALKLSDEHPVMGRFFAKECQTEIVDEDERKSLLLRFTGDGYAWTNITGRIGFSVISLVEYSTDFQLAPDQSLYVYFRPKNIQATTYSTRLVESIQAKGAMVLSRIDPDRIGRQILSAQLERGFTVIRQNERGETDYGMGVIPVGTKPFTPFQIVSKKLTLANDRTELHAGQQDFVGGFEVTEDGQALTITANIDGAPAVDVLLLSASTGQQMLERYVSQPGPVTPTEPGRLDETILYGSQWQRTIALPPGAYLLLLDHSAAAGRSAPPQAGADDRAVKIDYAVQIGDAP